MPEMHLKQPGCTDSTCGPLLKAKKEFKNLQKQEIQDIYTEINWTKPIIDMIWLMEILNI